MSKVNTWMPLHIADYLADTGRLNTTQHGAYLLLLMEIWRNGPMRDDVDELAAVARTDARTWKKSIWPTIEPFFQIAEGRVDQKRLAKERAKALEISDKRRDAVQQRNDRKGNKPPATGPQDDNKSPTNVGSNEDTRALSRDNSHSSPFHSEETSSLRSEVGAASAAPKPKSVRASRLPADWQPDPDQRQYALDQGVDPGREAENFREYWLSKAGQNATKTDWGLTWRTWVRRSAERGSQGQRGGFPTADDRRRASDDAWANVQIIPGT